MQLKDGMNVYTWDGEQVGSIDRVVINPRTKQVTHVVVRKGFLFTEDKVVPLEMVMEADNEGVMLRRDIDDLDNLPHFEETHYLPVEETPGRGMYEAGDSRPTRQYYWYPPAGVAWWGYPGWGSYVGQPDFETVTERNIPDNTVALREGADVYAADGERVGGVERLFMEEGSDRATHFVISEGLIFKDKKLIPTAWVETVGEKEIHLSIESHVLENMPEYTGD
jgi:uncharacterized protein YrrD